MMLIILENVNDIIARPVALDLKTVRGGEVDIVVFRRDHHVPAERDVVAHHLR